MFITVIICSLCEILSNFQDRQTFARLDSDLLLSICCYGSNYWHQYFGLTPFDLEQPNLAW